MTIQRSSQELVAELMAFHDACTMDSAGGDGQFRIMCSSGSSEQALALRAVLRDAADAALKLQSIEDGWPSWFPASPADAERGEELFVGGYTWTINAEDGPKHYKYHDGGWHRISSVVNDHPILATAYPVSSKDQP